MPCPTTCSAVPAPQGPTAGHSITAQFSGCLRVGRAPAGAVSSGRRRRAAEHGPHPLGRKYFQASSLDEKLGS